MIAITPTTQTPRRMWEPLRPRQTEREFHLENHRALVRFSAGRIQDLERAADGWSAMGNAAMAASCLATVKFHQEELERHTAAAEQLEAELEAEQCAS